MGTQNPKPQQRHPQPREAPSPAATSTKPRHGLPAPRANPNKPRNNQGRRCWAPQNPKTPTTSPQPRAPSPAATSDQTPPRFASTPRQPQQAPQLSRATLLGIPEPENPQQRRLNRGIWEDCETTFTGRPDRPSNRRYSSNALTKASGSRVPGRRGPRPAPPASPARPAPSEQRPRCHPSRSRRVWSGPHRSHRRPR